MKRNHLNDEILRNLQLDLKGLEAQQYTEIKHKTKSMYDNNHGETIKDRKRNNLLEKGPCEYKSTAFKFT